MADCGEIAVGDPTNLIKVTAQSRLVKNLDCLRIQPTNSIHYRNVNAEASVAVNPLDENNVVIATTQDFYVAQRIAILILYSKDGGQTWNETDLTSARCQGPTLVGSTADGQFADRPDVFFDQKGNVFVAYRSFTSSLQSLAQFEQISVVLAKSTDGGVSWNHLTTVSNIDRLDNNALVRVRGTTSVTNPDTVYLSWNDGPKFKMARSRDGGQSWKEFIVDQRVNNLEQAVCGLHQLNQSENHALRLISRPFDGSFGTLVYRYLVVYESTDDGDTWQEISYTDVFGTASAINAIVPQTNPTLAISGSTSETQSVYDPLIGRLYATTTSRSLINNKATVQVRWSDDNGLTWLGAGMTPFEVKSLTGDTNSQTFISRLALIPRIGAVGLVYYDMRYNDVTKPQCLVDCWLRIFDSDMNLVEDVRLTPQSFDIQQSVGVGAGYLFSRFVGLTVSDPKTFVVSFVMTNPTAVVFPPASRVPATQPRQPDSRTSVDNTVTEVFPQRQSVYFTKVKTSITRRCRCRHPCDPIDLPPREDNDNGGGVPTPFRIPQNDFQENNENQNTEYFI